MPHESLYSCALANEESDAIPLGNNCGSVAIPRPVSSRHLSAGVRRMERHHQSHRAVAAGLQHRSVGPSARRGTSPRGMSHIRVLAM